MRHVFIINPKAGNGKSLKISKIIDSFCKEKKVDYKIIYTTKPNEAEQIIQGLREHNIIYSVGGDGTLKEVVNGVAGTNNFLSVIPCGSGNDFEKSLNTLSKDIHSIDLGMINSEYFINIASLGIEAEIANYANLMKQTNFPIPSVYNASILSGLCNREDINVIINGFNHKLTLMAICNGRYYGHGFKIAPDARLNDGLFDVYMVDSIKTSQIPGLFLKLIQGKHEKSEYVKKFSCYSLRVESPKELICNIDGEIIRDNKFNFELIEGAIRVDNRDIIGIKQYIKTRY